MGSARIDQWQDPELSIEQAINDYRRLGYSETIEDAKSQELPFDEEKE